jgi:Flp pilus assembly protein TadD
VLALIDGHRDLRAIAATLGRSDFDVAKTLFGLESAGLIVLLDPGTAPRGKFGSADAAALVATAEAAFGRHDLDGARAAAEQAAAAHPHDPAVHLLLGRIQLAAGRAAPAADELRRAQRLDPLAVAAYRLLGYALVQLGRFAEAVEQWQEWERLLENDPAESAHLAEIQAARSAAQLLAGAHTNA